MSEDGTVDLNEQMKPYYDNLASMPTVILEWIDEHSQEIIAVWNQAGNLLFITKSVTRLLGYQPSEFFGMKWKQIFSSEDATHLLHHMNQGIQQKVHQFTIPHANHTNSFFDSTIAKVIDQEHVYYVGAFKHMTNPEEVEKSMMESEKTAIAGQLSAGIAHEIRNPLTSLKGFLQLLQGGVEQKEVYYKIMADEIDKIEVMASELLFISKPFTENRQVESIQSMIKDVIILLRSLANTQGIIIDWTAKGKDEVYCDRSQVKQALINIIKNAIEATEQDGVVQVVVNSLENEVQVDVMDEGPIIPKEVLDRLGEPYFTTKSGGTGLGLMITKKILAQHEGQLNIISNNESGNIFRMILPLARDHREDV
ncbi:MAG TPA: ATP-binding protein [Virgibacillus sp.]|nr:ATP-binding protein [Virgibacillus sp.]